MESHGRVPFTELHDQDRFEVAGTTLRAATTPGHTPGSTCFIGDGFVFSGDTLFEGGPGATRWDYSSFETIIDSIRTKLFCLPPQTAVHTGHGPSTTIGAESVHLQEWIDRGW